MLYLACNAEESLKRQTNKRNPQNAEDILNQEPTNPIMPIIRHSVTAVLEVKYIYFILENLSRTVDMRFTYVASFRNEGGTKAIAVDNQILLSNAFLPVMLTAGIAITRF